MTPLNSRQLNQMILRYLEESGFEHSAFILQNEASINKESNTDPNSIPSGALITFVDKGIQYMEMEENLKNVADDDFVFIKPFDLLKMNAHELKQNVEEKNKQQATNGLEKRSKGKEKEEDKERVVCDNQRENKHHKGNHKLKKRVTFGGSEFMGMSSSTPQPRGARSSDVLILDGHSAEVWTCAWSPAGLLLASGSGDSTARIWSIEDRTNSSCVHVLKHAAKSNEKRKNITTLDWNLDGTLLATGSYDGLARIWDTNGELKSILSKHKGPIFSVKWNKKGDHLLTGSFDQSVIVWDVNANERKQQFKFHSGPTVDVDWRTNRTFASGSSDSVIYVCKIGESHPLKMFSGHKNDINCIKWDRSGLLLASCSDDTTAKIWNMNQDTPILDFKDHTKEIYSIRWSPAASAGNNKLLLASASFDSTVKLWDVGSGSLLHSLDGHRDAVYSISFSPNGEYLASGSGDKSMNIWSVKEGKIVKTYSGNGSICEVNWNKDGNKIAYSTQKNKVYVLDVRM